MGVGTFSDCIFFLKVNSLPLKEKKKLKNCIISNGGEVSYVLNEKCTHAVVSNAATLNNTQQKKIAKHSIALVNPDFIWKSEQAERLIEVEGQDDDKPYEVTVDEEEEDKKNLFFAKFLAVNKKKNLESNLEEELECEDSGNNDHIPDDTEVAKYCCFQKDKEYAIVELLCFNKQSAFPFRISTLCGVPGTSQKEFTFHVVETAEKAGEKYEQRFNDLKNKGFTQIDKIPLQAENLASKALQKVLLGEAINITELSPEVAGLVESIWVDAIGHLDSILSCPVENISLNDLSKAEGILCQLRKALIKKDKEEDISQMMQEFYRCVPHKEKICHNINMKFLTVKQDLCQVIRDMTNVCETSLSTYNSTSTAKYQALRCRVEYIDPNSAEFHQVKQGILDNNHSNREFNILRVFRVGRISEAINFKSDVGNVKPLLHASSPCNFVGILSRGLMLPKMIVEEFGGERTDVGNLGSGIYFSDSISTSLKYSQPSDITGSRLLVVCDVALGKCTDVFHRDYTITEPPNGFHSVHGVQRKEGVNSDFTDDEYVVYDVNQVQMRYVVQFSTNGDNVDLQRESLFISIDQTQSQCTSLSDPSEDISLDDLPEKQVTKCGLEGSDGQQVPLESIHVKARLMDLAAKVVIFQTYKNNSSSPIEAKYVFPLDDTAAVCGFEAFINGKHIIGEVKEKQQAHREYRTAISEGHGAYLMDQDAPDVFTVSVGNLPSKATVIIKITYVMELKYQYRYLTFSIPGNMAQWQQDKALKENTQDTVTTVGIESDKAPEGSFCLDMSIKMPRKINNISCFTHKIKMKKTECTAVIQTEESSSFNDQGFSIELQLEEAYIPRMWVEKHPDKDSEACMLIFKPEIEYSSEDTFLTICLDCSNSMESCFHSAKQVALLALHSASFNYINIVLFGSHYKEMYFFPKSHRYEFSEIDKFLKEAKPNMGSTDFWKVLQSLSLLTPKKGSQKVFLISDGHIQNENLVFQILNKNQIQLFTCGVGTTVNKHMLRCLAQYGSGAFEYFADKSKSRWRDLMENQNKRLQSTPCTAISVKWRRFSKNSPEILQAPTNIQALFSDDSLCVYGFVPYCTQATLKALVNNKELENMVSTTELQKTTGTMLHTLTARALIKDYEDGILHEKEDENEMKKQEMKSLIIELSKEYSIVTQFTSFVAVEKRTPEEILDIEPNALEIISEEDVDILPYMDWSSVDQFWVDSAVEEVQAICLLEDNLELADHIQDSSVRYSEEQCIDLALSHSSGSVRCYEEMDHEDEESVRCYEAMDHVEEEELPSGLSRKEMFGFGSFQNTLAMEVSNKSRVRRAEPSLLSYHEPVDMCLAFQEDDLFEELNSSVIGSVFSHAEALNEIPTASFSFASNMSAVAEPADPVSYLCGSEEKESPSISLDNVCFTSLKKRKKARKLPQIPPSQGFQPPTRDYIAATTWLAPPPAPEIQLGPGPPPFQPALGDPPVLGLARPASGISPAFGGSLNQGFARSDSGFPSDFGGVAAPVLVLSTLGISPAFGGSSAPGFAQPAPGFPSAFGGPPAPVLARSTLGISPAFGGSPAQGFAQPASAFPGASGEIAPPALGYPPLPGPPPPPPPAQELSQPHMGPESKGFFASPLYHPRSPAFSTTPHTLPPVIPESRSALFGAVAPQAEASYELSRLAYNNSNIAPEMTFDDSARNQPQEIVAPTTKARRADRTKFSVKPMYIELRALSPKNRSQPFSLMPRNLKAVIKKSQPKKRFVPPSWSSLSSLQNQDGYWLLSEELCKLININVQCLTEDFLVKKGIKSLGSRGIDTIHKLIATLLVLQTIRAHNILSGITFKTLLKLDPSVPRSQYPSIEKAIEWAIKSDRQYPGICMRLGLGRDWDQATRQLLNLDPIPTSDLHSVSHCLFLL